MTLPVVPGNSMSFSQINTELGLSSTATISLNDAAVRTLAGVGASPAAIAITNLSGKSNTFSFTISSGQTNANLRTLAVNAGWPGTSKVIATIGSGIYISSNSTGTPALTVDGSFPGGVELINNGLIVGMGGSGGAGRSVSGIGGTGSGGAAGSAGGLALSVSVALTLNNAGTVAGGGGGGGGGAAAYYTPPPYYEANNFAGGGGGGGRSSNAANSAGGAGGSASGGGNNVSGGSGGSGTVSSAGSGGTRGAPNGGVGGAGGNWGAAGSTGGNNVAAAGGVNRGGPFSGGGAGGCITGNSNITYIATGTRLGSIS
jgi:hypothetical protein